MRKNFLFKFILLLIANIGLLPAFNAAGNSSPVKNFNPDFYTGQKIQQRYIDTVFHKVEVKKDLVFGEAVNFEGKPEKLLLDVYSPLGDSLNKRPVIMWIHGGGFRYGNDKSQSYIVRMSNEFAKRGYVCLSINYRLRNNPKDDPKGTMSDALEDAGKAFAWLKQQAVQLKIDTSKIIVGGGSAGGKLASNFCYTENTPHEKREKSGIVGLVNLWGSTEKSWTFYEIDKNDPPTIIVHGTKDELIPYELSIDLVEKLKMNHVPVELITIEDAGHTPTKAMGDFVPKIAEFLFQLLLKH